MAAQPVDMGESLGPLRCVTQIAAGPLSNQTTMEFLDEIKRFNNDGVNIGIVRAFDMHPEFLSHHLSSPGPIILIDCRTTEEFEAGHIEGALNYPLTLPSQPVTFKRIGADPSGGLSGPLIEAGETPETQPTPKSLVLHYTKPDEITQLVFYCSEDQVRSSALAIWYKENNIAPNKQVLVLFGGIQAWQYAGGDVAVSLPAAQSPDAIAAGNKEEASPDGSSVPPATEATAAVEKEGALTGESSAPPAAQPSESVAVIEDEHNSENKPITPDKSVPGNSVEVASGEPSLSEKQETPAASLNQDQGTGREGDGTLASEGPSAGQTIQETQGPPGAPPIVDSETNRPDANSETEPQNDGLVISSDPDPESGTNQVTEEHEDYEPTPTHKWLPGHEPTPEELNDLMPSDETSPKVNGIGMDNDENVEHEYNYEPVPTHKWLPGHEPTPEELADLMPDAAPLENDENAEHEYNYEPVPTHKWLPGHEPTPEELAELMLQTGYENESDINHHSNRGSVGINGFTGEYNDGDENGVDLEEGKESWKAEETLVEDHEEEMLLHEIEREDENVRKLLHEERRRVKWLEGRPENESNGHVDPQLENGTKHGRGVDWAGKGAWSEHEEEQFRHDKDQEHHEFEDRWDPGRKEHEDRYLDSEHKGGGEEVRKEGELRDGREKRRYHHVEGVEAEEREEQGGRERFRESGDGEAHLCASCKSTQATTIRARKGDRGSMGMSLNSSGGRGGDTFILLRFDSRDSLNVWKFSV